MRISGAKNAATKQIVASLLTDEPVILHNVPHIGDIGVTLDVCRSVGLTFEWDSVTGNSLRLHTPTVETPEVPLGFSGLNRIPILLLGPLLHRYGKAVIPMLGGDDIGTRPVDFHIRALEQLGAQIVFQEGRYYAVADRLRGAVIELPYPSVGATENTLFAAVLAEGTTLIKNAAVEPEIMDQVMLLQKMGAIIFMDTDRTIVVEGVERLSGAEHTDHQRPDRGGLLRDRGDHHGRRCAGRGRGAGAHAHLPQQTAAGRRGVRGQAGRYPLLSPPLCRSIRSRWRPTSTPAS